MSTFAEVGSFFGRAGGRLLGELPGTLEMIGRVVQKTAAAKLGVLQPAVGPFPAWKPLAPATVASKGHAQPLYDTGELKESGIGYTVQSTRLQVVIGSPLDRALFAELGTATEPPRPFLGPAVLESEKTIIALVGGAITTAFGVRGERLI